MVTFSIIRKSQLEGALRLDAEYYQPEYLEVVKILQSTPHKNFNEVVSSIINGAEIREYVEEDGLAYLRVSDIKEFFIDSSSVVHISKESKLKQNIKLKENDILLSRSGSLAIAAVVTPDLSNSVISSHLMRIPVKGINPYFLVAFLNSKFGKDQIIQRNNGTIVPEINHPSLKSLLIPVLSEDIQKEIEKIVRSAYEETQESNKIYSQAENLLLEELGLKNFESEDGLWNIVKLFDIKKANRIDAEYFQSKYEKLISKIKNQNSKTLEDFVKEYSTGFPFKSENYQEQGVPLIRINNIRKGFIDLSDSAYLSEKDYLLSPKDTANFGDIVLSMSGTIGMTAIIPDDITKCSINQRILRITSKDIDKNYLALLLNSIIGLYQLERIGTGGVQTNISYKDIRKILIPSLPKPIQQKIADLVQKSHEARKKAKELLEQAKQKVEETIEK